MSIAYIRKELNTRLVEWAVSQDPPVPVVLENESFDKPSEGSYLEAFLLPAPVINSTLDGERIREVGIFQVNIWTKNNPEVQGTGRSDRLAQSVISLFPVIPKFSDVSVDHTPSVSKYMNEDGWRVVPVTIQYRYESKA